MPQSKDHLVSLYLREDRHVNISQTSQNSLDGQFGPSSLSQVSFVSFLRAVSDSLNYYIKYYSQPHSFLPFSVFTVLLAAPLIPPH